MGFFDNMKKKYTISLALSFLFSLSLLKISIYFSPWSAHSTYSLCHSQPPLILLPLSLRCSWVQGLSKPFPQRSMAERDPFNWRQRRESTLAAASPLYHSQCSLALTSATQPFYCNTSAVGNAQQSAATKTLVHCTYSVPPKKSK